MTEDDKVEWHNPLNGHVFKQTPRHCEGQGSLSCCSPRGRRESDTSERLNNNKNRSLWEGRGINSEFETNRYTLLYVTLVNNKDSEPYSLFIITYSGKEPERIHMHVMYVCMYVCMHVCMYVHIDACN